MSFQYVIDNAQTLSISKRKRVAQTVSRSGRVKTVSVGGQVYEFSVRMPDGPRYSDERSLVERVEALDRTTIDTINLGQTEFAYISQYLGDQADPEQIVVQPAANPTQLSIVSGVNTSGYIFRAGDYIQLGSGSVYNVTDDVFNTQGTIPVHRPVLESSGNYQLQVGQSVSWDVICVEMPTWTIFGYDQISWSGDFVFVEAL